MNLTYNNKEIKYNNKPIKNVILINEFNNKIEKDL